jgi:hypothetical protein
MPTVASHDPRIGVIVDRRTLSDFDETVWSDGIYVPAAPDEPKVATIGRMLDQKVDVIAVAGGDRLIADVLSVHRRHFRHHPTQLRLFAFDTGQLNEVASHLDAPPLAAKSFRRLERAVIDAALNRRLLPTLKVTSSAKPAARVGFSFGAGLFYRLFEAYHRGGWSATGTKGSGVTSRVSSLVSSVGQLGKDMLVDAGRSFEPIRARVAIDGRPRSEEIGYLLASSLDTSWLGLSLLEERELSFRMGQSGGDLARQVAKARALPRFMQKARVAEAFDRIHVDFSGGYVLDGELFEPSKPYVVQVEAGPVAHFVTL